MTACPATLWVPIGPSLARWTAALGLATERLVLCPILGQPAFAIVVVTIGVGYVARGLATMVPGVGTRA